MDDDGGQPGRHRQPDDVRRVCARRTSTKPPQIAGAMLSPCAEPAPRRSPSSAQAIRMSERRVRAKQRVRRRPPPPRRSPRCRRGRSTAAGPCGSSARRRASRRAASAAPARRRRRCSAPPRAASRPSSPGMSSIVTPRRGQARRHLVARLVAARTRARRTRTRRSTRSPAQTRSQRSHQCDCTGSVALRGSSGSGTRGRRDRSRTPGSKPQSARAAESSTSAGHESTIP